ncbi:hypothetical protein GOODEAATRI_018290 [Goodea atripinnis]|uniref:Uncharacterized protein n=1 Tax=Goodea atripinnis TaxID=208336 RepID=A0ABV0MT51_9TELE
MARSHGRNATSYSGHLVSTMSQRERPRCVKKEAGRSEQLQQSVCSKAETVCGACFQTSRDLVCFLQLDHVNVYLGHDYKSKYKAPTDYCMVLKVKCLSEGLQLPPSGQKLSLHPRVSLITYCGDLISDEIQNKTYFVM